MGNPRHYLDQDDNYYYMGTFGSDDGVDACKDMNAEMGLDPYNRAGFYEARRQGFLRKVRKDSSDPS